MEYPARRGRRGSVPEVPEPLGVATPSPGPDHAGCCPPPPPRVRPKQSARPCPHADPAEGGRPRRAPPTRRTLWCNPPPRRLVGLNSHRRFLRAPRCAQRPARSHSGGCDAPHQLNRWPAGLLAAGRINSGGGGRGVCRPRAGRVSNRARTPQNAGRNLPDPGPPWGAPLGGGAGRGRPLRGPASSHCMLSHRRRSRPPG